MSGTSACDGLSLAWAVAEYLARAGARTLFATHYHYLNDLAKTYPCVKNYRVAVKEQGDQIVWLHKVMPGGTDRSYGIQVARMAGVPGEVIGRAQEILKALERGGAGRAAGDLLGAETSIPVSTQKVQMTLFEAEKDPILEELQALDVTSLTPVEALMKLDQWKRRMKQAS